MKGSRHTGALDNQQQHEVQQMKMFGTAWGWSNTTHTHRLGEQGLESSSAGSDLGVLVTAAQHQTAACCGSQEAKLHCGVH